jgi:hypothetical protein
MHGIETRTDTMAILHGGMIDTIFLEVTEDIMAITTIDIGDREEARHGKIMPDVKTMIIATRMKGPAGVVWTAIVQLLLALRLAPFPPLHTPLVRLPRNTLRTIHERLLHPLNPRLRRLLPPLPRTKPFPHPILLSLSHFQYGGPERHWMYTPRQL